MQNFVEKKEKKKKKNGNSNDNNIELRRFDKTHSACVRPNEVKMFL